MPPPAERSLRGLHAVVTGGNRGIGLALAAGLCDAGARVSIWGRDREANDRAVDDLRAAGGEVVGVVCDVGDEEAVELAMVQSVEHHGPLGCVMANAGIAGDPTPLADLELAAWHRLLRTNLDGTFLTTRAAARRFIEQGDGGSMVIVSSTSSRYGAAGQGAYATTKTGLLGLARTFAVELARHRVRCNVLVPGWTSTEMNTDLQANDRFVAATTQRTPVRRWADPGEFAAYAAFLADPTLTFHTGNEVVVDGGYSVF